MASRLAPIATPMMADGRDGSIERYRQVRQVTESLGREVSPEDQVVQSMPDASPMKWHFAHTTWFFETFLLAPNEPSYELFDPRYGYLFNSYYEAVGARHPRPQRGMLTRPTIDQVLAYRAHVDTAVLGYLRSMDEGTWARLGPLLNLGLHHEEQHQELILTDILHLFSCNPVRPAFKRGVPTERRTASPFSWHDVSGGIYEIGHDGAGFAFDHERPRHEVLIRPYRIASRPVTNAEWLAFMDDDGYRRAEFWLSDGWANVRSEEWQAPLYWERRDGEWWSMTLRGMQPVEMAAPVCHVSHYEADAYASWAGKRLPTEQEWEIAAADCPVRGNWMGSGRLRPAPADEAEAPLQQLFGDVWELTGSAFTSYPGYRPAAGAVGEYNGKFMSGQVVLRGGSCVTPDHHTRASYRNFFYPHQRWQFSGLRLAEDAA